MHQFLPIQSVQQAMDLDMICNHWPTLPKHEKTTNGYHRAKYHIQNDRDDYNCTRASAAYLDSDAQSSAQRPDRDAL